MVFPFNTKITRLKRFVIISSSVIDKYKIYEQSSVTAVLLLRNIYSQFMCT